MTNLIEQLGGYDACSNAYKELISKDKDIITCGSTIITKNQMYEILLEHRRQHNIFEVGDKVVVKSKPIFSDDYKIHIIKDEYLDDPCMGAVRHATDKEIAQGYRDE